MIGDRSGMALVLTLLAVSFLVAISVQLVSSVNWQMQASVNIRDSVRLDALNRSGLNLIRASLLADQKTNNFDSLHDAWNSLDAESMSSLFDGGELTMSVDDLSGKLQVNALVSMEKDPKIRQNLEKLQYDLWMRFLTSGRFAIEDEDQAITLIDSIKDWIDKDDNERENGAEKGFYLSYDFPYSPRNGEVLYLEELLHIRGMTDELFYGNKEYLGLAEYLSVAGSNGKININSAPKVILQALAEGVSEEMGQDLIEYRQDKNNKGSLASPEWYKQAGSFPGDITINMNLLTVESYYFQVTSTARINEFSRTGRGILYRDDNGGQKLLQWEVK